MVKKNNKELKTSKVGVKLLLALGSIVVACVVALLVYSGDYYKSEISVEEYMATSSVRIEEFSDGLFVDGGETDNAVIFYPGGKVEYTAYLPLCAKLAEQGVDCFLVKMPFHLAVFGSNKADGIISRYSYENWYLAGHSLGGAMVIKIDELLII